MTPPSTHTWVRKLEDHRWLLLWAIAVIHALSAYLGLTHARVHGDLSMIYPSVGFALAVVLLFGPRVWPAIAASAFLVPLGIGAPVGVAVGIMAGNTAQVLFVGMLLRVSCGFDNKMERVKDVLAFVAFGVGLAPLIGALAGTLVLSVSALIPWEEFVRKFRLWWLAEAMGILVVTPTVLVWLQRGEERVQRNRRLEGAVLFILLAAASQIVYSGILEDRLSTLLSFVCFPFVIWSALRFGQRGATAATLVAVIIALENMVRGSGPLYQSGPTLTLVYLFAFSSATMVTALLLGAVVTQHRAVTRQLQQASDLLEARVADRTGALREQLAERERVSVALRDSEERYRRISQTITDYIYTVSFVDGHPVRTSHAPTCEAVTGYSSDELAANPFLWLHMVHADDRELVLQLTPRILATHKSVTIEHRIVRKDGVVRWVQNTTAPTFDAEGKVNAYDGLVKDITDRKNAEEALRESEGKFRAVFESSGIGIVISALEGKILECNRAMERMLGYAPGELVGQPLKRLAHPDDLALHRDRARRTISGEDQSSFSYDARYLRKDGSLLWGHVTSALVRDSQEHPRFAVGLLEDITARKRAELDRESLLRRVQAEMANLKTMTGLVPICATCKKIRDEQGGWIAVEEYVTQHTGAQFSHGICPDCLRKLYPDYADGFMSAGAPPDPAAAAPTAAEDEGAHRNDQDINTRR